MVHRPQPRNEVPAKHAARIVAAKHASVLAAAELRTAVVTALKAGASVREVAKVAGMSTNTVQRWGHDDGWPTEAQKREWARAREEREAMYEHFGLTDIAAHLDELAKERRDP